MSFSVLNVRGDGHCFYRCVWRLAVAEPSVADDLCLEADDLADEDAGVREIRDTIASYLGSWGEGRVRGLLELHRADPSLAEFYPVLAHAGRCTGADEAFRAIVRAVRETRTYASELELSVLRDALDDVRVLVLSCASLADPAGLADRWMRDLHKSLPLVDESRVAVLINENNVHYRLGRFRGRVVIDAAELRRHIEERMAEPSDSDDSDDFDDSDDSDRVDV